MNVNVYADRPHLRVRREGRVLRLTLDRAEKRNAIDGDTSRGIADLVTEAALDPEVGVVALAANGPVFSAGGDIKGMQSKIDDPSLFYAAIANARRLVFSLLDCPKPIVCRVQGDAVGLGATLALLCDIVVVDEAARLADPHVKVGLVAGDGGALLWPALIGYARAKRFLLSGDPVSGCEAAAIGLVTEAVPAAELDARVEAWVSRLASGALQSIAGTKLAINAPLRQAAQTLMDIGMAYEGLSNITADHREAVAAFRDKRPPTFTGR